MGQIIKFIQGKYLKDIHRKPFSFIWMGHSWFLWKSNDGNSGWFIFLDERGKRMFRIRWMFPDWLSIQLTVNKIYSNIIGVNSAYVKHFFVPSLMIINLHNNVLNKKSGTSPVVYITYFANVTNSVAYPKLSKCIQLCLQNSIVVAPAWYSLA